MAKFSETFLIEVDYDLLTSMLYLYLCLVTSIVYLYLTLI